METAYGATLANDFSRKVRGSIQENPELLDVRLQPGDTGVQAWKTTAGGGFIAAGIGGPITGRGADVLCVDDPHKSWAEALSANKRQSIRQWFGSTARSRLEPRASIIIPMTRWHYGDLSGSLARGKGSWEVISLPALAGEGDPMGRQPGEPLWPERFSREELERTRDETEDFAWWALWQQNPLRDMGAFFHRDWFKLDRAVASGARYCRRWDFAGTEPEDGTSQDPDWTVGVKLARWEGKTYIVDVVRVRREAGDLEALVAQTAKLDGRLCMIRAEQEPGSSGKNWIGHLQNKVLVGYDFEGVPSTGDKTLRARPVASAAKAGNVFLIEGPWNQAFLEELEAFPGGQHDDQVDATSGGFEDLGTDFSDAEVG